MRSEGPTGGLGFRYSMKGPHPTQNQPTRTSTAPSWYLSQAVEASGFGSTQEENPQRRVDFEGGLDSVYLRVCKGPLNPLSRTKGDPETASCFVGFHGGQQRLSRRITQTLKTLSPIPSPQPSTLNPQPSTLNPQPSTLNPQPSTLDPKP